ncbi:DUF4150 domain-containing protein [Sorangium sp. So ce854]|uniref:DUF4150 domain-containing protein n=1 Tax=Sorangium sp. So ce854 TaxID=3133322 RepID=UPI003F5F977C
MPLANQMKMVASASSGHTSVTPGPIDACKTPTPGGPVPMPYPNIGVTVTIGPGYTTKTLAMGTPMYTKKSKMALTNGDQPGVALGVVSNRVMGMAQPLMSSNDVLAESGGVARTFDSIGVNQ